MEVDAVASRGSVRQGVPRAKTAVPRLSPRYLHRPRLLDLLDGAAEGQVTLVSAPPGYGKTLLLAEWAAGRTACPAWVSLDGDDNDDQRFWTAVLTALGAAVPPGNPLSDLGVPVRPSHDPAFLAAVVDAVDAAPGPVHLILDDVHELTAPAALHGLRALVRDRPPGLRLILSGRTDPPLPLSRMRLAGQLCEVRARELRFSVTEAEVMLATAEVPARPEQVRLLVEETEGWPAGLRLAALSLREAEDIDRFLADFIGNARAVSDYLVGEILSRLPPDTRDLLHAVSVCDQLSAPLAAALSGRTDAGEVLDSLERQTSLVLSSGAGRIWYRVHPLLRSHLRADLHRRRPDLVMRLHGRAADWFTARGELVPGLAHAQQAGDPERVELLVRRHALALVARGDHAAVGDALGLLGASAVAEDPWLALVAAMVELEVGGTARADGHLADVEAAWPPDPGPELRTLRAIVRARRAGLTGDPAAVVEATERLGQGDDEQGLAPTGLLDRALALVALGRTDEARQLAERAADGAGHPRQGYLVARALTVLGAVAGAEGDYRGMARLAERADAALSEASWRTTATAALASVQRAYAALLLGEPALSLELAAPALAFASGAGSRTADPTSPTVVALRGAALFDLGHHGKGLDELRSARTLAAGRRGLLEPSALVAVLEHRAATTAGRGDLARTVLAWAEEVLGSAGDVLLLRARRQAAHGREHAAIEALQPVLDGSAPVVLPWTLVEARVLECGLDLATGARPAARRALERALELSATMGVRRPLATGPAEVVDLLARHLGSFADLEPVAEQVLDARLALGADLHPAPLTGRERSVLLLLATHRSLQEIAADLTVSLSTVKTHVRAIYAKLGVNSRREAVVRARRQGLLQLATDS
jgi:LuxR family maltose regulon positive regulatory protein